MEELNKILQESAVPIIVTIFAYVGYLLYLVNTNSLSTSWSFLLFWGLPFMVTVYVVGIVAFVLPSKNHQTSTISY